MRVLVAGAAGVMGRALLPQLIAAGHEPYGLARSPEGLLAVDRLGAKAVRGDLLDAEAMLRLVAETKPDAVVNLATLIPHRLKIHPKDWEPNDRVRVEGSRNLLAAAAGVGVRLFVQESAGYVCASQGANWMEEDAPLSSHPFMAATLQMERQVQQSGVPTTLLRFGALMSGESWHTQQSVAALRRGLLPVIGDGSAYVSLIHVEDAASAIFCALSNPDTAAKRTYNVVDSEPAPMRDVLPCAAKLLNAPTPRQVPPFMAKLVVGALTVEIFSASYRLSNSRIRQELGFSPRYPSYRELWVTIASEVVGQDFAPSEDLK